MEDVDRKLLIWISLLALLGGGMNAFAILEFSFTASHITGSMTKISLDLAGENILELKILLILVFSFFGGAIFSGILVGSRKSFEFRKRYGDTFIFIGVLLKILKIFVTNKLLFVFVLSFSLGLQNGLFISYKGMMIRTTHITGTMTDLGVSIGNYLRGQKDVLWKIECYALNIVSFVVGGILIGFGLRYIKENLLDYLSAAYIFSGVYYFFIRDKYLKNEKIKNETSKNLD